MTGIATSRDHLLAHLEWVDLLVHAQVLRFRRLQRDDDRFRGLAITEEEVDRLLERPTGLPVWATARVRWEPERLRERLSEIREGIGRAADEAESAGVRLRLREIVRLFSLDPLERDVLLLCLAPELDSRYRRLYAYLQDDVTRKHPTVDFLLDLVSRTAHEKLEARSRFEPDGTLVRCGLVDLFEDPQDIRPTLLEHYVKLPDRVVRWLLGSRGLDERIRPWVDLGDTVDARDDLLPGELVRSVDRCVEAVEGDAGRGLVYLQGPRDSGKSSIARLLTRRLDRSLLTADLRRIAESNEKLLAAGPSLLVREALLEGAVIYLSRFDALLDEKRQQHLDPWLEDLSGVALPVLLGGEAPWMPVLDGESVGVRVEVARPDFDAQLRVWSRALDSNGHALSDDDLRMLPGKFRMGPDRIARAAGAARGLARSRDPKDARVTVDDVLEASRLQSNRSIGALARKIEPTYTWDDIVLPDDRMELLRQICHHVEYRGLVYGEWGFGEKLSLGKGLNVLFAGPSGTGKTMAAGILAGELGLDLYKIDLSGVVSKYIGETEKNLSRIFEEAETSNAILFFDEADALFGKRSAVRDSHDRYANVEISYLLQRMEEYEGVVILATNLRKNMDEAFVRRMHFMVDFPFPDEESRRRIWEGIWPEETPKEAQVDFADLAHRFDITGGNIRNIAVAAAFLAAEDGGRVGERHLMRAARGEYGKMGKVVTEEEFSSNRRARR